MSSSLRERKAIRTAITNFIMSVWFLSIAPLQFSAAQDLSELSPFIEQSKGQVSTFWLASGLPGTMNQWDAIPPTRIEGQIVEMNDRELIYVPKGSDKPIRSIGDQVIAIEVAWGSDKAKVSHSLFAQEKYQEYLGSSRDALTSGVLKWQQRAIVCEMAMAAKRSGRWGTSADLFLRLSKEKPPAIFYCAIPLVWTSRSKPDVAAMKQAEKWIQEEDETQKLIAASWLVSGNLRSEALQALKDLQQSKNPMIQKLAIAQQWRAVPAAEVPSQRLVEWTLHRDSMPQPLQVGPTLVIADKLDQAGKSELAIPEWIRVMVLHRDQKEEAAQCRQRLQEVNATLESNLKDKIDRLR